MHVACWLVLALAAAGSGGPAHAQEPPAGEPPDEAQRRGGALGPRAPGETAAEPPPAPAAPAGAPARVGVATGAGVLTGRPTVRPPRILQAPVIDGRLDDAVWRDAAYLDEFVQRQPLDGAPATEATEVYIAYDSANIYIGAHVHYSRPNMIRANRADRDRPIADDAFLVYFDPFLDQQRAYVFGVNGYGVQSDSILNARGGGGGLGRRAGFGGARTGPGGAPRGDFSWDALYETAGQLVDDGYVVEMAIPFKSLRYPQRAGNTPHRWGFQIARTVRGKDESVVWSPVTRSVAGFLTQMGVIEGMTGLSTSRNLEFLPTFTAVRFGALDAATGGFAGEDIEPEGGVNIKYGVTSDLTADVTFNPDFSQIESDQPQIEVNQRFDLFFPELRPFFLEGAEIFQFRGPVNLVHTRTIVNPRYGAKLTGKAGNTTIGVMYADDEVAGALADPGDPAYGSTARTFVGRVRYDLYAESFVGAIFTDRQRAGGHNRVAGIDSNFRLGDTHSFGLRAVGSEDVRGDGTRKTGYLLNASLQKQGRNVTYALGWYDLSPDFDTEVGFLERTDQRWMLGTFSYRWWPESWLINWGPRFTYSRSHSFNGVLEDQQAEARLEFEFTRNITLNATGSRVLERYSGVDFRKTRFSSFLTVSTSRRIAVGLGIDRGDQIFFDPDSPYLGADAGWIVFFNARLFDRLQSNVNIVTNRFVDPARGGAQVFDVKIARALTTFQFTDRFLFRNITEYNSLDKQLGLNALFTYRINAGTVFYAGYDDRYRRANRIDLDLNADGVLERPWMSSAFRRENRAIFVKFQYLFRL